MSRLRKTVELSGGIGCLLFICACSSSDSPGKEESIERKATPVAVAQAVPTPPEDSVKMAVRTMMGPAEELQQPNPNPLDPKYVKDLEPIPSMAEALKKYSPAFIPWKLEDYPPERIKNYPYSDKSLPYAVKGDFNGDGVEDMVIAGTRTDLPPVIQTS